MTHDGLVFDLEENLYHSLPGLSSTGAKRILRSPAHYQHYLNNPHETKDEFDVGSLVHAKVLGVGAKVTIYPDGTGPEEFEYVDEKTGDKKTTTNVLGANGALSTNLSKAFAAEARSHGLIPMKRVTARVVNKIAESVLGHDEARALFEGGRPEVSMFHTDADTGALYRGRLDYLRPRSIADLKTTAGAATESDFSKQFYRLGYEIQFGLYDWIYTQITGETLPFLWVVVESEAPYLTNVFALDDEDQKNARERAQRARDRYARCLETGRWPGYVNGNRNRIGLLKAPMFAVYDFIDEGNAA